MQILYVGNGNYNHRGARYYDVGRKLVNGLIRGGHNVYFFSDRDTARAESWFGASKCGAASCNRIFLETCANFSPDLILFGHADLITLQSLQAVRKMSPRVKMAQFNVDSICNPHTIAQIKSTLPCMDATFITTGGPALKKFHTPNGIVCYIPNPIDDSIEWPRCFERSDQPYDVFWTLRALKGSYADDLRLDAPLFLEKSGKVNIRYYGMNGQPLLYGAEYFREIAKAKMGLNISVARTRADETDAAAEEMYLYASDRLSQYMGSGLLIFAVRKNRLEDVFAEDKEMVFFSTKEELLEKIIYYKNNDAARREIARAGWEKSHRFFNEKLVAKYIVEKTFRLALSEPYAWPVQDY